MILHHIYWDTAHHWVFIRSRLVILPPCLPLVSATGISKPALFKFSLLRWLELGNFIMLTFQLFIVGIPSCYNVFTSIGGVGFDFHLNSWKECNIARPMGVFGVWGAAQSYCLDYLKYMSTNKYLLHFIWPFENNIIIHRNNFDFRNWIRNLKRKRFRKSTLDRKTNNCTLNDVIGCFVVILASRSFWQTLVRTLLNFAANGNWDNRKVSWHLEAKSILTRRSGLQ